MRRSMHGFGHGCNNPLNHIGVTTPLTDSNVLLQGWAA